MFVQVCYLSLKGPFLLSSQILTSYPVRLALESMLHGALKQAASETIKHLATFETISCAP